MVDDDEVEGVQQHAIDEAELIYDDDGNLLLLVLQEQCEFDDEIYDDGLLDDDELEQVEVFFQKIIVVPSMVDYLLIDDHENNLNFLEQYKFIHDDDEVPVEFVVYVDTDVMDDEI